jgi:RNA polymerase sigma factor (sigma-70 family)
LNSVPDTIQDIIEGCKRQDRKSQEQLYRNYFRAMMTLCVRYTKNEADAMEVLNTGFYKVFKNIDRYDESKASLYTWIRAIVINSCLAFIRSKTSRQDWKNIEEVSESASEIGPSIIAEMSASDILGLVRQLAPSTQAVFNLYVMEGFSHKEIASMLGISIGTSKWHLSEARRQLQDRIKTQQKG